MKLSDGTNKKKDTDKNASESNYFFMPKGYFYDKSTRIVNL